MSIEPGLYGSVVAMRSSPYGVLDLVRRTDQSSQSICTRFCSAMATIPIVTFGPTDFLQIGLAPNLQLLDAAPVGGAAAYCRADAFRDVSLPQRVQRRGASGLRWMPLVDMLQDRDGHHKLGPLVALVQLRISPLIHLASTTPDRVGRVHSVLQSLLATTQVRGEPTALGVTLAKRADFGEANVDIEASPMLGLDRTELYIMLRGRNLDVLAHAVHCVRTLRVGTTLSPDLDRLQALLGPAHQKVDLTQSWQDAHLWHQSHTIVGAELINENPQPDAPPKYAIAEAVDPDQPVARSLRASARLQFPPSAAAQVTRGLNAKSGEEPSEGHQASFVFGSDQMEVIWRLTGNSTGPVRLTTVLQLLRGSMERWDPSAKQRNEDPSVHQSTSLMLQADFRDEDGGDSLLDTQFRKRCLSLALMQGFHAPPRPGAPVPWESSLRKAAADIRLPWGLKRQLLDVCTNLLSALDDDPEIAAVGISELAATVDWLCKEAEVVGNRRHRSDDDATGSLPLHWDREARGSDTDNRALLGAIIDVLSGMLGGSLGESMLSEPRTSGPYHNVSRVGRRYIVEATLALVRGLGWVIGLDRGVPLVSHNLRPRTRARIGHSGGLIVGIPSCDRLEFFDLALEPALTSAAFGAITFQGLTRARETNPAAERIWRKWVHASRALHNRVPQPGGNLGAFLTVSGKRMVDDLCSGSDVQLDVDLPGILRRMTRGIPSLLGYHLLNNRAPAEGTTIRLADSRRFFFLAAPTAVRELNTNNRLGAVHRDTIALALLGLLTVSWLVDRRTVPDPPPMNGWLDFVEKTLLRLGGFEQAFDRSAFTAPPGMDPELAERILAIGEDLGLVGGEALLLPGGALLQALTSIKDEARTKLVERMTAWLDLTDALTLAPGAASALRDTLAPATGASRDSSAVTAEAANDAWHAYLDTLMDVEHNPARGWYPFADQPWPSPGSPPDEQSEYSRLLKRSVRRQTGSRLLLRTGGRTRLQPIGATPQLIESEAERTLADALWTLGGPELGGPLAKELAALPSVDEAAAQPGDPTTGAQH